MGVARLVLIGRRMVFLLVGGPEARPDAARVQRFLKSLRITDGQLAGRGRQEMAAMPRVGTDGAGRRVYDYNGGPVPPASDLPGLVLYLPFDQPGPGDQVIDAVTGRPAARLAGGATYGPGVRGKGLDLTAKGRYLDYAAAGDRLNFKANAPFTFALWVRTAEHSSWGRLFSQRAAQEGGGIVQIGWKGTGYLSPLLIKDGARGTEQAVIIGPQLKVPFWNHVALTRRPDGELALFVNGSAVGSGPGPREPGPVTTATRVLGMDAYEVSRGLFEHNFVGEMDEFCVFNRALAADEVQRLAGQK
jgi:hypothetical protein